MFVMGGRENIMFKIRLGIFNLKGLWKKSRKTSATGQCVLLRDLGGKLLAIIDSKNKDKHHTALLFLKEDVSWFVEEIRSLLGDRKPENLQETELSSLFREIQAALQPNRNYLPPCVEAVKEEKQIIFHMFHIKDAKRRLLFTTEEIIAFLDGIVKKEFDELFQIEDNQHSPDESTQKKGDKLVQEIELFLSKKEKFDDQTRIHDIVSQIEKGEFAPLTS
jgi:hypothetical protein